MTAFPNPKIDFAASLIHYAQAFEQLAPETIHSELAPLLAEDIYFEDPFNQLHGKARTLQLFDHMFETVLQPHFRVLDYSLSDKKLGCAFLYWQFSFIHQGKSQRFDGMSKVLFNQNGLICSHIDYWDPGKHIYAQIPVLGWLLGKVNKRLALPRE